MSERHLTVCNIVCVLGVGFIRAGSLSIALRLLCTSILGGGEAA